MNKATKGQEMPARRSPLTQLLLDHYDTYADQIGAHGFDWSKMVRALASEGVMDGEGDAPIVVKAKAVFSRVRTVKIGKRPKRRPVKPRREIRRTFQRSAA